MNGVVNAFSRTFTARRARMEMYRNVPTQPSNAAASLRSADFYTRMEMSCCRFGARKITTNIQRRLCRVDLFRSATLVHFNGFPAAENVRVGRIFYSTVSPGSSPSQRISQRSAAPSDINYSRAPFAAPNEKLTLAVNNEPPRRILLYAFLRRGSGTRDGGHTDGGSNETRNSTAGANSTALEF